MGFTTVNIIKTDPLCNENNHEIMLYTGVADS